MKSRRKERRADEKGIRNRKEKGKKREMKREWMDGGDERMHWL